MKFQTHSSSASRRNSATGFTFVELMVAIGVGALLLLGVAVLTVFASWTFQAVTNYVDLDNQSRQTEDVLGREIRNATQLIGVSSNNPAYLMFTNAISQTISKISYDTNSSTVTLQVFSASGTTLQTNLTQCDQWSYAIYDRAPTETNNDILFNTPTNWQDCKIINMTWKCSRMILGSKRNTESVQTAQIVLRNQVKY